MGSHDLKFLYLVDRCKDRHSAYTCDTDTVHSNEGQDRKFGRKFERGKWKPRNWGPQDTTH